MLRDSVISSRQFCISSSFLKDLALFKMPKKLKQHKTDTVHLGPSAISGTLRSKAGHGGQGRDWQSTTSLYLFGKVEKLKKIADC